MTQSKEKSRMDLADGSPVRMEKKQKLRARGEFGQRKWFRNPKKAMVTPRISSPIRTDASSTNLKYSLDTIPLTNQEHLDRGHLESDLPCDSSSGSPPHEPYRASAPPAQVGHHPSFIPPGRSISIPDIHVSIHNPVVMRRSVSSQGELHSPSTEKNTLQVSVAYTMAAAEAISSKKSSSPLLRRSSKSDESFHVYEEFHYGQFGQSADESPDYSEHESRNGVEVVGSVATKDSHSQVLQESLYETVKFGNNVDCLNENVYEEFEGFSDPGSGPTVSYRIKKSLARHFPTLTRSPSKIPKEPSRTKAKPKKVKEAPTFPDCKRGKSFFHKLFHFKKDGSKRARKERDADHEYETMYEPVDYDSLYEMQSNHVIYQTAQKTDQSTSTSLTSVQNQDGSTLLEKSTQVDIESLQEPTPQPEEKPLAGSLLILKKELMNELKLKMEEKRKSLASNVDETDNSALAGIENQTKSTPRGSRNLQVLYPKEMLYTGESTATQEPSSSHSPFQDTCDYSIYFPMAFQTPDHTPPLPPKTRARPLSPTHDVPLNNTPVAGYSLTFPQVLQDSRTVRQSYKQQYSSDDDSVSDELPSIENSHPATESLQQQFEASAFPVSEELIIVEHVTGSPLTTETEIVEQVEALASNNVNVIPSTEKLLYDVEQQAKTTSPSSMYIRHLTEETHPCNKFEASGSEYPENDEVFDAGRIGNDESLEEEFRRKPCSPPSTPPSSSEHPIATVLSSSPDDNQDSDPDYDFPRPHLSSANNGSNSPDLNDQLDAIIDSERTSSDYECGSGDSWTPRWSQRNSRDGTVLEQCRDDESVLVQVSSVSDEPEEDSVILRNKAEPRPSPELRVSYVATETVIVESEEVMPLVPANGSGKPKFQVEMDDQTLFAGDFTLKRPSQIPTPEDLRSSGISHLQEFLNRLDDETGTERQGAVSKLGHSVAVAKLREFFEKEGGHSG